ncbi:MAG: alpha/beta hydrolase, partial [Actinomycetota bacterium]|nr:alpha/beta hydrolase [Actinomycetota bacterium]
ALADALRAVPRSRPFADLHALEGIECPAVVVGSRDEADPEHPLALAESYAELLPRGRLAVEEEGRAPLAWQGGRLSRIIAELAAEAW